MDMTRIFVKTGKGREEIATRQDKLGFKERAGLIQTDGKKTASQVPALIPGGTIEVMDALLSGGYIELSALSETTTVPTSRSGDPAGAVSPGGPADLAERKRVASRAVSDLLGPGGDVLTLSIEAAKNEEAYLAVVAKATTAITQIAGSDKARMFTSRLV